MGSEQTTIKVLLVDDHETMRWGLRRLLEMERDIVVIGEASGGEEVLSLAPRLQPDVIIMDIRMPGVNGLQAAQRLIDMGSEAKIILLSMYDGCWVSAVLDSSGSERLG